MSSTLSMLMCLMFPCTIHPWIVNLTQGPVQGYLEPDYGIYSFYGIPYATAPKGNDRFKAPLPAPTWNDTFDAVDNEIICPQNDLMRISKPTETIQEECLIANVYVPNTNRTNLPVLIIVHGGAYVVGWGNMFTPKKLVKSKEIIAVTFNYRLGPQGFLCLGTKDVPGNAGMRDQVALIKWVKTNIASFGGNPDDIIISGFSSGAASVDVLMLSKMTKGFFKKVISEGGAGLGPYGVQLDPIENAKTYARLLNFTDVDDLDALERFYKSLDPITLNSVQVTHRKDGVTLMSPCIELDLGEERFLEDSPINILKSGNYEKLPTLYGFTDMDGLLKFPQFNDWIDEMNTNFSNFLPADLHFKDEFEKEAVVQKIKSFYFGDKPVSPESSVEFIHYYGDIMFSCPMLRTVKYLVEAGHKQVYLYEYSFVEDSTPVIPHSNQRGANHCAQTFSTLDGFWNDTLVDEQYVSADMIKQKEIMRPIWLSFMTKGYPELQGYDLPQWPPVKDDWSPHMSMNRTFELINDCPIKERNSFWRNIYDKYYRRPIPPSQTALNVEFTDLSNNTEANDYLCVNNNTGVPVIQQNNLFCYILLLFSIVLSCFILPYKC
ncbi:carboxylic ester hydrolase-like [Bicyclus anynana]|uniref:Carboxylic ester hydrolase n=1 Tax=Bicyclus anynana TaxID=110368 RepID=A0A6J1PB84_BICAN|nr:carboxylic ester hydrolase-like [Bicyclus anynana]